MQKSRLDASAKRIDASVKIVASANKINLVLTVWFISFYCLRDTDTLVLWFLSSDTPESLFQNRPLRIVRLQLSLSASSDSTRSITKCARNIRLCTRF